MSGSLGFSGGGVGAIQDFAQDSVPGGWLVCDGSAVSRSAYASLFAHIGEAYGAGDGSTTFNIPDFRDRFRRGLPVGGTVGTYQDQGTAPNGLSLKNNGYSATAGAYQYGQNFPASTTAAMYVAGITLASGSSGNVRIHGDTDTRPKNIHILTCIKY